MKKTLTIAIVMALFCTAAAITACAATKKLEPAKKGYIETGKYRNYLKELGFSQAEIDGKISEIYSIIF